jgi:ParB family transcriptional regulator, chromosome partitioning protein
MPTLKPTHPEVPAVVPAGQLRRLNSDEIKPSTNNPRMLFDTPLLLELKKNIAEHGVLVPITVYQPKGQVKFSILDGERRYRCVIDLKKEGHVGKDGKPLKIPANIVEPPSMIAGLLYMFSIHNFRADWELMPTALSLKIVMEQLEVSDNTTLSDLTGLSERQIERCKSLLTFPERFQKLSLDPDPTTRIPSNFWIEALPVIDLAMEKVENVKDLGRDGATDKLVAKYRDNKIKSVIHFRRIMESYDLAEDDPPLRAKVVRRIEQFFLNPKIETRAAFDEFVIEKKRVQNAIDACEGFITQLRKFKLRYTTDEDERKKLQEALAHVRKYCESLEQTLIGSDDPEVRHD